VKWVIQFAPFGILGLVFKSVSESGMDVFSTYGQLVLLLVGCMLTTAFVFNPLISFLMLRRNPYPLLFTCLKVSGLQAFFTRSSAANIPINLSLCKKLGLDEEFYSVSIPLGATINMNGAAVTVTVFGRTVRVISPSTVSWFGFSARTATVCVPTSVIVGASPLQVLPPSVL
jgi:serine/threonine transporter